MKNWRGQGQPADERLEPQLTRAYFKGNLAKKDYDDDGRQLKRGYQ